MGLIFHGKKESVIYLFGLSKKNNFFKIDTSNGDSEGQDSNGKGQMPQPFLSFALTIQALF